MAPGDAAGPGPLARLAADPKDPDAALQAVRFELYRENIYGALEMVEAAHAAHPHPSYVQQATRIRSWLTHLESREAYVAAQDAQYRRLRWRMGLKLVEKRIRILLGRKTRKMIERRGQDPEFQALEREVAAVRPRRVLDAGSGEGGVAMALAARHPDMAVDGVEVSATNVKIAGQLNRFGNARFREGLAEEVHLAFPAESFDLIYSFAVLEHVRDVDETIRSIMTVLRPGGRFCFVVPMHEFRARGPIPDYAPVHGYADHCRVFSEGELYQRFGGEKNFTLQKIPGAWKHGELPACFEPIEFGSFFVSYSK
ncbi:MAG: class I SAM-dependent methyltransferase [Candidatus Rokuibacteriota bacterium]